MAGAQTVRSVTHVPSRSAHRGGLVESILVRGLLGRWRPGDDQQIAVHDRRAPTSRADTGTCASCVRRRGRPISRRTRGSELRRLVAGALADPGSDVPLLSAEPPRRRRSAATADAGPGTAACPSATPPSCRRDDATCGAAAPSACPAGTTEVDDPASGRAGPCGIEHLETGDCVPGVDGERSVIPDSARKAGVEGAPVAEF